MPSINLILKGLIAIFVNEDKTECTVGILRDPPPKHELTVTIIRQTLGGAEQEEPLSSIADELRLDIQNTSQTGITFRDPNAVINRKADPTAANRRSFKWFVDLENNELYNRRIGARRDGFRPILTFNRGELFTRETSKSHLFYQEGIFSPVKDFGFVAIELGVEIILDQPNSKAVFTNGSQTVFDSEAEPDTNFTIDIKNDAEAHTGIVTDANHYYKAVGLELTERERILFMSFADDSGPAGPEAACFSSFFGESQPE